MHRSLIQNPHIILAFAVISRQFLVIPGSRQFMGEKLIKKVQMAITYHVEEVGNDKFDAPFPSINTFCRERKINRSSPACDV